MAPEGRGGDGGKSALFLALQVLSLSRHDQATIPRSRVLGHEDGCALWCTLPVRLRPGRSIYSCCGPPFCSRGFVSRGFHTLPDGQSTTEVLCAWSAPKSRKIEARPLRTVLIIKAVSVGRKETTKWDRELNFSNYNPREEKHRKPGIESLLNVSHRLVERGAGHCNFARFLTHKCKRSHSDSETVELFQPSQPTCLPELACDEDIPISSVIDVEIMGTIDKQG